MLLAVLRLPSRHWNGGAEIHKGEDRIAEAHVFAGHAGAAIDMPCGLRSLRRRHSVAASLFHQGDVLLSEGADSIHVARLNGPLFDKRRSQSDRTRTGFDETR